MPMAVVTISKDRTGVHESPLVGLVWKIYKAMLTISARDVPEYIKESQVPIFGLPLDVERHFRLEVSSNRFRSAMSQ